MPLTMQAKLLRVLEEGEMERIGGERAPSPSMCESSSRPIATSKRKCAAKFRRIYFIAYSSSPALASAARAPRRDIPALIEHFALEVSTVNGWKPMCFLTQGAMAAFNSIRGRAMSANLETQWSG